MAERSIRLGIDWGGTKMEIIALGRGGETLFKKRIATPQQNYQACIAAAKSLVEEAEKRLSVKGTLGIGIPGTISPQSDLVKNANSTWLNGKPLLQDMEAALSRPIRIQNDANCFAVSETIDGAGKGHACVLGIILGTGCGAGLAFSGKPHIGANAIAGEFGHTTLSPMHEQELPGHPCWCGKHGCVETYLSGPAFKRDYESLLGEKNRLDTPSILALENDLSKRTYQRYLDRLARALSILINIIDPDCVVFGGGMSNIKTLCKDIRPALGPYIFSDHLMTKFKIAKYGDSSGVRGAAWLWN